MARTRYGDSYDDTDYARPPEGLPWDDRYGPVYPVCRWCGHDHPTIRCPDGVWPDEAV